ncbi:8248_t:CDS:2 [Ambispora gerdemannii]|uniref:8248_t:CDS:1 n=1 Tax=Ambispora gerdemannii TaxID=144530 RepID=A0A9N9AVU9_9GLOM|nr:8248_t:CDS:2 [Ambispora gerdemannii]
MQASTNKRNSKLSRYARACNNKKGGAMLRTINCDNIVRV